MLTQTTLAVDGHVHIYSHYDLEYAIDHGISNLLLAAKKYAHVKTIENLVPIWLLVERHDSNFFNRALNYANELHLNDIKLISCKEKETLVVQKNGKSILYILAGRQIVTKENLEVLSLVSSLFLKDREHSIDSVINQVLDSGGIPAINWAPGKWFFSRGKLVEQTIKNYSPESLLISDTSLRTTVWRLPGLMAAAKNKGFKIIAGSDPLPFKNEEKQIGCYGFSMTGNFDNTRPAESIRIVLKNPQTQIQLIGKRNDFFTFSKRQFKIMRDNKSVI